MMLLLLALSVPVLAQDGSAPTSVDELSLPGIDSSLLRPAPDARLGLALPEARVQPGWTVRADLQHIADPIVFLDSDGERTALLASVTQLDLGAAWGVGNLRLAATMPAVLHYQGDTGLSGATLGDPAAELKVSLLPRDQRLGLALLGGLRFPLGADAVSLGESGITGHAALLGDLHAGPWWLALQAGARFRPQVSSAYIDQDEVIQLRGAVARELSASTHLAAELLTETALDAPFADYEDSPTELLISAGHRRDSGLLLRLGAGLGLVAGPGSPAWRLIVGVGHASPEP